VEVEIELTVADVAAYEEDLRVNGPDWREDIEPVSDTGLDPVASDRSIVDDANRAVPSLFAAFGWEVSKGHNAMLSNATRPLTLPRLAYFARGWFNVPPGEELADGVAVLGERYEAAAKRFAELGLWSEVKGTAPLTRFLGARNSPPWPQPISLTRRATKLR
jgi:hypothetical protein